MDNNNDRGDKNYLSPEEEQQLRERMAEQRKKSAEKKLEEQKKKAERDKKRGKYILAVKIFLVVVVVLSLLFVAAQSLGNVTFSKAVDYVRQAVSNLKPGEGYPVEIGSGVVIDMQSFGDCVALLEDDSVILLNSTAKEIARYPHTYSMPILTSCNGKMLLCDRTTGRYMLLDRRNELHTDELKDEVYCCAIGKTGNLAFSVKSDDCSSILKVIAKDFTNLFDFKCSDEYITGVSLSPNGKYAAAIGIGASHAFIYSKLYIIDINEQAVVSEFRFDGEALNSVFFSGQESVVVVSENSFSIITDNKDKKDFAFDNNTISRFSPNESGSFSLAFTKYGSIDEGTVSLFDSMGAKQFSATVKANIECIDFDGKTVCISSGDDSISCFNTKGELVGKTKLDIDTQKIVVSGKYVYSLCFGSLMRFDVKTDLPESTSAQPTE